MLYSPHPSTSVGLRLLGHALLGAFMDTSSRVRGVFSVGCLTVGSDAYTHTHTQTIYCTVYTYIYICTVQSLLKITKCWLAQGLGCRPSAVWYNISQPLSQAITFGPVHSNFTLALSLSRLCDIWMYSGVGQNGQTKWEKKQKKNGIAEKLSEKNRLKCPVVYAFKF